MHHVNWWAVAFFVSAAANNAGQYMPPPGTAPGFISSPWYPMIFHTVRGVLAANPLKSLKTVQGSTKFTNSENVAQDANPVQKP